MLPILQIGPLAIQTPGLILLFGLWTGLYLSEKYAVKKDVDPGILYHLVFWTLISALIGARLGYIIEYPQAFIANPLSIISINPTLFNWWAGAACALIFLLWYGQRQNLDFWLTLDLLTPAFATLSLFIGVAHLASGSAFGSEANIPWAIELWGKRRHPTQIYEILSAAVILGFVFGLINSKKPLSKGALFLAYLVLTSASKLFVEAFRGDSQMLGQYRLAQLGAWLCLAVSLWLLGKRMIPNRIKDVNNDNPQDP
jgi:phosphatidylglycerol---prolipoprotein diacylglyceryl transferase